MFPMKQVIVAFIAWSVIACGTSAQAPANRAEPVLRGRIVDAANGLALRRARVTGIGGTRQLDPVLTDDEGTFAIHGVADATLRLRVVKAGYAQMLATIAREERTGVLLALTRSATVTGRVLDAYGAFVQDASVSARLIGPDAGAAPNAFVQAIAGTDLFGEYRLGALRPGRYEIAVVNAPRMAASTLLHPTALARFDDDVRRGMPLERLTVARTVDLGPGAVSTIDLTVPGSSGACAPPAPRPPDRAATGSLRGTVRGPAGEPLPCATVRLVTPGIPVRPVTTDERGRFTFDNLPAGTYRIEASNPGYVTFRYGQQHASHPGTPVTLRTGQSREDIAVVLPRRSTITGTIIDDQGEPLADVTVQALQLRNVDGRPVAVRAASGKTDDLGRYRLGGLARGTYLVEATPEAVLSGATAPNAPGYGRMYYPGTADASTALRVVVDLGVDATAIDVTVARTSGANVSGFVFDRSGKPFTGLVLLSVSHRSGAVAPEPRQATVDANGAFVFRAVAAGDYVVQATRSFLQRELGIEFGMQYVTVADGDPAPVRLITSAGATVEGRVVIEGSVSDEWSAVGLTASQADFDRAPVIGTGPQFTRFADGRFRIVGITGPQRFAMASSPVGDGWYLKSVTVNGADALDRAFDFGMAEAVYRDVEVLVSNAGATIAGRVEGDWSTIAAEAEATIFSVHRDLWFRNSRHVKSGRVAQDGTFRVTGLPPGEYFVALSEAADPRQNAWPDSERLETLAQRAERLTLAEGEQRSVVLPAE